MSLYHGDTTSNTNACGAQVSQLFKLGSLSYEDVKQFSCCVEEALFRLPAHRDRALTYKMEEVTGACASPRCTGQISLGYDGSVQFTGLMPGTVCFVFNLFIRRIKELAKTAPVRY